MRHGQTQDRIGSCSTIGITGVASFWDAGRDLQEDKPAKLKADGDEEEGPHDDR
ncbi:hypothetical protein [Sneathiella aquimaris]|uniref:hypothetical protein n=1 Tax=Sneathiella aquimaris TaxID=2599305 RepID=UPI00146C8DA6|nr:hypothetical protein [Sneathiella aquimaris]